MHCAQRVQRVVFGVSALLLCVLFSAAPLRADEVPAADSRPAAKHSEEIRLLPFKGYDLDGKPVDVAAAIGNRPVMLVFWASWCGACRAEMPQLNRLAAQYGKRGMEFIGVNIGHNDTYKRAKAFAVKAKMPYPTLFDGSGDIGRRYRVQGIPTMVIADKRGIIRYYGHETPNIDEAIFAKLTAD